MKKKLFTAAAVFMALIITATLAGCKKTENKEKTVCIIANGETQAYWKELKKGADAAGEKYGYKVMFNGTSDGSAENLEFQRELLLGAINTKPEAMAISTVSDGFYDLLIEADKKGIPLVEFENGIGKKDKEELKESGKSAVKSFCRTGKKIYLTAAAKAFENLKKEISEAESFTVGIMFEGAVIHEAERAEIFEEEFTRLAENTAETKGKVVFKSTEISLKDVNSCRLALEAFAENEAKFIFMADELIVNQVKGNISANPEKYKSIKFCGCGAGGTQTEWMKSNSAPLLIGSVVCDAFNMGYNAVKQAVMAAEGREVKNSDDIGGVWWNAENVDRMIEDNIVYEG